MKQRTLADRFNRIMEQDREKWLWLVFVLLTLPHFNPAYLNSEVRWAELIINGWRVVSACVIITWLIGVKRRCSLLIALIGIQQCFVAVNTLIQKGAFRDCAISSLSVMSVVMLYDLMQDEKKVFLSSQLFCFELMIYINLITEIVFPNGLYINNNKTFFSIYKCWFLGIYNTHTCFFLPALLTAFLYKETTGKKLRTYLLTASIFISALLVWSGSTILMLFGVSLVYLLFKNRTKLFNYFTYWLLHVWFLVFIIFLRLQDSFRWLIDGILGKWGSLTSRISLWDKTIKLLEHSLLFGYGQRDYYTREMETGLIWASQAHNLLLETLYRGGLINLTLFIMIIYIAGKRVYHYKDTKESQIISLAFLGWCIVTLVESFTAPFLVAMFVTAYYSNGRPVAESNIIPEGLRNLSIRSFPVKWTDMRKRIREGWKKSDEKVLICLGLSLSLAFSGILFAAAERFKEASWEYDASIFAEDNSRYDYFHELPRNTVDYLILGDCQPEESFEPMMIYARSGITGYHLGSKGQQFEESYERLAEASKRQSFSRVFLSVQPLIAEFDMSDEQSDRGTDMAGTDMEYIGKIKEFCDEKGISLIPVLFPAKSRDENSVQRVEESLQGYEITEVLDLGDGQAAGIDWELDTDSSKGRLNQYGITKTSLYLAGRLSEQADLEDHRGVKKYVFWDNLADIYRDWEEEEFLAERMAVDAQIAEAVAGAEEQLVEEGLYTIVPFQSGECVLDIAGGSRKDGGNVQLWTRNGKWPQEFALFYKGNGVYEIYVPGSGKYVGIANAGSVPASNVVQQDHTGLAYQKWILAEDPEGGYNFISLYNGLRLDVVKGINEPGTNVQVWTKNGSDLQRFALEKIMEIEER